MLSYFYFLQDKIHNISVYIYIYIYDIKAIINSYIYL